MTSIESGSGTGSVSGGSCCRDVIIYEGSVTSDLAHETLDELGVELGIEPRPERHGFTLRSVIRSIEHLIRRSN